MTDAGTMVNNGASVVGREQVLLSSILDRPIIEKYILEYLNDRRCTFTRLALKCWLDWPPFF